jgi:hypothetical protein
VEGNGHDLKGGTVPAQHTIAVRGVAFLRNTANSKTATHLWETKDTQNMTCKFIIDIHTTTRAGVAYAPPKDYNRREVFYNTLSLYDLQQFFRYWTKCKS